MFNSLGWPELVVLLVLGMFVVGPDRLPGVAAQAAKALHSLRTYARGVRDDLADDLGPEIRQVNLRTLSNPRGLIVKHVLAEETPGKTSSAGGARRSARQDVASETSTTTLSVPQQQQVGSTGPGTTPS